MKNFAGATRAANNRRLAKNLAYILKLIQIAQNTPSAAPEGQ
jgi:hypothetical protein